MFLLIPSRLTSVRDDTVSLFFRCDKPLQIDNIIYIISIIYFKTSYYRTRIANIS